MTGPESAAAVFRGTGPVIRMWWTGSLVMGRWTCRCVGQALRGTVRLLRTDTEATRTAQEKVDKVATGKAHATAKRIAAAAGEDEPEVEPVKGDPVKPVLRPWSDTLPIAAIAAMLGVGAGGAAGAAVWPYVQLLADWRGVIFTGAAVFWTVGAFMVAPAPPAAADAQVEDEGGPDPAGPAAAADEPAAAAEQPYVDEGPWLDLEDVADTVRRIAGQNAHTGVHFADLLAEPMFEGWTVSDIKSAFVDEWGVPIGRDFKLRWKTPIGVKERVRMGVRLADLNDRLNALAKEAPPAPAAAPAAGPAAGPVEGVEQTPVAAPVPAPAAGPTVVRRGGLYLVHPQASPGPSPDPSQTPSRATG